MPCSQQIAPSAPIAATLQQLAEQIGTLADLTAYGRLPAATEIYDLVAQIKDVRAQVLRT